MQPALQAVAEHGLSNEAQQHALAALLALSDTEIVKSAAGQKHIMLSCKCMSLSNEAHQTSVASSDL